MRASRERLNVRKHENAVTVRREDDEGPWRKGRDAGYDTSCQKPTTTYIHLPICSLLKTRLPYEFLSRRCNSINQVSDLTRPSHLSAGSLWWFVIEDRYVYG